MSSLQFRAGGWDGDGPCAHRAAVAVGRWAGRRTHPCVREDVCDSRQGSGSEVWNMLPQGISFSA